jgi:triosephosphate isomerase
MRPVIVVNFKTYPQATGAKAEQLAKMCEKIAKKHDIDIRVAVQAADIYRVCHAVSIPVYAEHVDPIDPGRHTGYILAADVKTEGAVGTLLNHSEHRVKPEVIARTVLHAKAAGLKVIICAATPKEGAEYAKLKPTFVAVEPPELIGGKVSVSTAKPEIIMRAVAMIKAPLLVGAGIHTSKDVQIALKLGAQGVLLASGVTKAKDPKKALEALLDF